MPPSSTQRPCMRDHDDRTQRRPSAQPSNLLLLWSLLLLVCVPGVASIPCGSTVVDGTVNGGSTAHLLNCTSVRSLTIQNGSPDLSGLRNIRCVTTAGGRSLQRRHSVRRAVRLQYDSDVRCAGSTGSRM